MLETEDIFCHLTDVFLFPASEFTIVAAKCRSSGHIGRQAKHYTLRAASPQEKWTWKHILEQRVALCKSHSLTENSEESSCHFI